MFRQGEHRRQIDAAIADGKSLDEIERTLLDPANLGDELSSALWLYAMGALERAQARPPNAASPNIHLLPA
ncbi:MAG: hypothetical protein E6G56_13260 [Actinobacteria bacterium]|nr:MAG: hypothetical protein E6G56_13260 [Actinomycetota bacterium]